MIILSLLADLSFWCAYYCVYAGNRHVQIFFARLEDLQAQHDRSNGSHIIICSFVMVTINKVTIAARLIILSSYHAVLSCFLALSFLRR